ncbi:hypothetical protein [Actinophytocola sediminis]
MAGQTSTHLRWRRSWDHGERLSTALCSHTGWTSRRVEDRAARP